MARFGARFDTRKLSRSARKLARRLDDAAGRGTMAAGLHLEAQLAGELRQPGTGRTYTTRFFTDAQGRVRPIGTRPPHRASAPGQPPASDTGGLLGSLFTNKRDKHAVEVGVAKNYAAFLEFGTSKMRARPFLMPTARRERRRMGEIIDEHLDAEIRDVIRETVRD